MTLRLKTLLVIGALFAGAMALFYLASSRVFLRGFANLEMQASREHVQRVQVVLDDRLTELDRMLLDWASWDDTWNYLETRDPAYLEQNIGEGTTSGLNIGFFVYLDLSDAIVFSTAFEMETASPVPASEALLLLISSSAADFRTRAEEDGLRGIALLPEGPVLLAARPILTTDEQGPSRGTLVAGRYITDEEIDHLGKLTRVQVKVQRLDAPELPEDFAAARRELAGGKDISVRVLGQETIAGYAQVRDIRGQPALLLRADAPRSISAIAARALQTYAAALLIIGILGGLFAMVVLEKVVLARLARLSAEVGRIEQRRDVHARVSLPGGDELAALAGAVNRMLGALDQVHHDLRESEQKYRSLVERTPDVIYNLSTDGLITALNPSFEAVTGWHPDEWVGKSFEGIVHPDDVHKAQEAFVAVLRGARPPPYELRFRARSGDYLTGELSSGPLVVDGQVVGEFGIVRDITARKLLEEQLLHAQKLESIGTLAGGIAHDFNNLLTGILGYASMLKETMRETDPCYQSIHVIEVSAKRAADLTSKLLAFARGGKYRLEPVSLNRTIQDALQIISRTFESSIDIRTRLAENLPAVEGDASQLEQVVLNLAVNSRDAMPLGGTLTIETACETLDASTAEPGAPAGRRPYVTLTVTDTGVGMTREVMRRMYDPFFSTKPKGERSGLGLPMVYGIVKNHGGFIRVQSEVAQGSTFKVHLPASNRPEKTAPPREEPPRGGDELILVVEDEDLVHRVAERILTRAGYRVLSARNGQQGIDLFRRHRDGIALVILDMVMPVMSGQETFQQMQAINPEVKVLLSTAYSQDERAQAILDSGVRGFLQKPYAAAQLLTTVRRVIDEGRPA